MPGNRDAFPRVRLGAEIGPYLHVWAIGGHRIRRQLRHRPDQRNSRHHRRSAVGAGGTLIFGPKPYIHTGLSFTQNGIDLWGAGRGQTVLQAAARTTVVSVSLNPTGTTFKQPYSIEDMDVFGVNGSGIRIRYASVVNPKNVPSKSHAGEGPPALRGHAVITNCDLISNTGNGATLGKGSDAITLISTSLT